MASLISDPGRGLASSATGFASAGRSTDVGQLGFSDDAAAVGMADEMQVAGPLFEAAMADWGECLNRGETERPRICGVPPAPYDVPVEFEVEQVRHIWGWPQQKRGSDR